MDFVEFADDQTNDGTALFKTAEALSREAFFFSTCENCAIIILPLDHMGSDFVILLHLAMEVRL